MDDVDLTSRMRYVVEDLKCICGEPSRRLHYFNEGKRIGRARFWAIYMGQLASTVGSGSVAARGRMHVECPSCGDSWAVWETGAVQGDWRCDSVEDTNRSTEIIGEEEPRKVTNGLSRESPRSFKFTQQWTSTLTLETTKAASSSVNAKVPNFEQSASSSIQNRYGITIGESHSTEEEFTIVIPAKSAVTVKLIWKRVWQHGIAHMAHPSGVTKDIPFRVAVDLTFDQDLRETAAVRKGNAEPARRGSKRRAPLQTGGEGDAAGVAGR
jgi:hypothetical protein